MIHRTDTSSLITKLIVPLSAMLCLAAVVGGCAQTSRPSLDYSYANQFDREFERGASRRPIPETLYGVSRLLIAQGRYADAESILKRSVAEHPSFLPSHFELAELHMRSGRLGSAMETLSNALNVAPNNPMLLNNIGMCWLLRGEYDRALDYFTRAASIDPDDQRFRGNMATALGLSGRYGEALSLYEQIVSPEMAHYNLALLSAARRDHEQAAAAAETVRQLDPALWNGLRADLGALQKDDSPP